MPRGRDPRQSERKTRAARGAIKQRYLDAARNLFAEFGYSTVSFEQISESSGVSRAVLARSFRDKPAFLRAIAEEWLNSLFPEEIVADATPIDVVNRLLSFSKLFLGAVKKEEPAARIILSGLAEPSAIEESAIIDTTLQAAINRLVPIVLEGQQSGVIRREIDSRQAVIDWLRFLFGAALLPSPEAAEGDLPTQIIETLLHGVLKTDV
jgi:AcrR family transcriptional regulator